jgi:nicotinamidase-related amidase
MTDMLACETPDPVLIPLGSSARNSWSVSSSHANLVRSSVPPRAASVQAQDKIVTIDLARTAIIVGVDVTPLRLPIPSLRRILPALRAVDVPVVWLNWGNRPDLLNLSPALLHVYKPTGEGVGLGDPLPGSGARVLERESWSAAIVDELSPEPADILVSKYRMSGFQDTELDSILRNLGITTLLFAGVNADQCVLCTLQDANFRGYDCLLVSDCTATTSPDYCMEATLYNVQQCFGFVTQSSAVLAAVEGNKPYELGGTR